MTPKEKMMKALYKTIHIAGALAVAALLCAPTAQADQVILDDLIVNGSACLGFDCVNGESFGFDTLRLKENNLRMHFFDTSTSASFPSNDWRLGANDTSNGGLNAFFLEDSTAGRRVFTVEAGARANALYVEADGDIGIGTANPAVDLEIKTGNTPTLRLCQDGSSGFTAQTWDVAGNEANFFIRDVTNGSTLPIRLRPSVPTNAFDIHPGGIGLGTASPSEELHLRQADNDDVFIKVEDASGTAQNVGFQLDTDEIWNFFAAGSTSNDFFISAQGGFGSALQIDHATGLTTILGSSNLGDDAGDTTTVTGTFVNNSSRTLKTDFAPVDQHEMLERLAALPLNEWTLIGDPSGARHVGPFTEDFDEAFGLGTKGKYIVPLDVQGVTIGAVQGLYELVQTLQEQNNELRERLLALEQAESR